MKWIAHYENGINYTIRNFDDDKISLFQTIKENGLPIILDIIDEYSNNYVIDTKHDIVTINYEKMINTNQVSDIQLYKKCYVILGNNKHKTEIYYIKIEDNDKTYTIELGEDYVIYSEDN